MIIFQENQLNVEQYLSLRKAVNWVELSQTQTEKALSNSLCIVTAVEDGKVVGMGRVVGDGAVICYIQDLIILPQAQGKRIGQDIMKQLIAYVESIREENTELMLCLMCKKGRESFYEKLGFMARPNENLGPGMIMYL